MNRTGSRADKDGMKNYGTKSSKMNNSKMNNSPQTMSPDSRTDRGMTACFILRHPAGFAVFLFYAVMWFLNGSLEVFLVGTIAAAGTMAMETIIRNSFSESDSDGKTPACVFSKSEESCREDKGNKENTEKDFILSEMQTPVSWSLASLFSAPSAGKIIVLRKAA